MALPERTTSNSGVFQVLVDLAGHSVRLVDNPKSLSPTDFVNRGQGLILPSLGQNALIRIAYAALKAGYFVKGFEFLNDAGEPVADNDEDDQLSSELVSELRNNQDSGVDSALGLLLSERPRGVLYGIKLDKQSSPEITLRRRGVVISQDVEAVNRFLHVVDGEIAC